MPNSQQPTSANPPRRRREQRQEAAVSDAQSRHRCAPCMSLIPACVCVCASVRPSCLPASLGFPSLHAVDAPLPFPDIPASPSEHFSPDAPLAPHRDAHPFLLPKPPPILNIVHLPGDAQSPRKKPVCEIPRASPTGGQSSRLITRPTRSLVVNGRWAHACRETRDMNGASSRVEHWGRSQSCLQDGRVWMWALASFIGLDKSRVSSFLGHAGPSEGRRSTGGGSRGRLLMRASYLWDVPAWRGCIDPWAEVVWVGGFGDRELGYAA